MLSPSATPPAPGRYRRSKRSPFDWKLEKAGVKKWGESSEANYAAYTDFMLKWGIIKEKIDWRDLITNELIDDINKFDATKITAEAKAYKAK